MAGIWEFFLGFLPWRKNLHFHLFPSQLSSLLRQSKAEGITAHRLQTWGENQVAYVKGRQYLPYLWPYQGLCSWVFLPAPNTSSCVQSEHTVRGQPGLCRGEQRGPFERQVLRVNHILSSEALGQFCCGKKKECERDSAQLVNCISVMLWPLGVTFWRRDFDLLTYQHWHKGVNKCCITVVFDDGIASCLWGWVWGKAYSCLLLQWPVAAASLKVVIVCGWPLCCGLLLSLKWAFLLCKGLNYPEILPH